LACIAQDRRDGGVGDAHFFGESADAQVAGCFEKDAVVGVILFDRIKQWIEAGTAQKPDLLARGETVANIAWHFLLPMGNACGGVDRQ
jgi:hypothetical protein